MSRTFLGLIDAPWKFDVLKESIFVTIVMLLVTFP